MSVLIIVFPPKFTGPYSQQYLYTGNDTYIFSRQEGYVAVEKEWLQFRALLHVVPKFKVGRPASGG